MMMTMLSVLLMSMSLLQLATAEPAKRGGVNCKATRNFYGPTCYFYTITLPRPGATLQYTITVSGRAKICCIAYQCRRFVCHMTYIGCGHQTWSSSTLPWEGGQGAAKPRMQCKALGRQSVSYSFVTTP